MVQTEVLATDPSIPLEIPPAIGGHSGIPSSVEAAMAGSPAEYLVAWSDNYSRTFGLAKGSKAIVLPWGDVRSLSLDVMRPAKGRGWVALEAIVGKSGANTTLLQSLTYSAEALHALQSKLPQIEALFNMKVVVRDHGSDY